MTDAATHLASCWHSEKIQLHAPLHVSNRYRDNEEFDDSTIVICMSRSVYSYATIVISFSFFLFFLSIAIVPRINDDYVKKKSNETIFDILFNFYKKRNAESER